MVPLFSVNLHKNFDVVGLDGPLPTFRPVLLFVITLSNKAVKSTPKMALCVLLLQSAVKRSRQTVKMAATCYVIYCVDKRIFLSNSLFLSENSFDISFTRLLHLSFGRFSMKSYPLLVY